MNNKTAIIKSINSLIILHIKSGLCVQKIDGKILSFNSAKHLVSANKTYKARRKKDENDKAIIQVINFYTDNFYNYPYSTPYASIGIKNIMLNPNGKSVLVATNDKKLNKVSIKKHRIIYSINLKENFIEKNEKGYYFSSYFEYSKNGDLFVISSNEGINIYNNKTGKILKTINSIFNTRRNENLFGIKFYDEK